MTKRDMIKCYKDLSTCDIDKVEHVVSAIYQAFDTDNDGKVGKHDPFFCSFSLSLISKFNSDCLSRFSRIRRGLSFDNKGFHGRKVGLHISTLWSVLLQLSLIHSYLHLPFDIDLDKDGYIDQAEIDIMAKVERFFSST